MPRRPRLKILVVEDITEWRLALVGMYEEILGKDKCDVDPAASGPEAIRLLKKSSYDLLSADLDLSGTDQKEKGKVDMTLHGCCGHNEGAI